MNEVSFLGVSKDSSAIVMDMLSELYGQERFSFYPNKDFDVVPFLPEKAYPFEVHEVGSHLPESVQVFFGATGPENKQAIYLDFKSGFGISEERYVSLIHPTAYLAPSAVLENGVLVEPGVIVSAQCRIEFGVSLKRGVRIGHHNKIGRYTDINPGVTLSGMVHIGEGCLIGSGTVIKDNITIGANTTIGVGSVVTRDIPSDCVAFGNPCKVVRQK
ncbi:acetyltransferase [Algoriphagus namhaensis]